MTAIRNSSDQATILFEEFYYYFHRPQEVYGVIPIPPPPVQTNEVAEQTASVFDNIIYNETGGGNDGQVVVTQT